MKPILFVFFLILRFDIYGQDLISTKRDSGFVYLTEQNTSQYKMAKLDSCRFISTKTIFPDSIVQIIKSEKYFTEVFWYSEMRFTFYKTDSSLHISNQKFKCLDIKTDTVLNISAFRYLLDNPHSVDEETSIYFNPEIGIIYFLNYWRFFGKIRYTSYLPDLDTYDIDFHEFEEMLNYDKK